MPTRLPSSPAPWRELGADKPFADTAAHSALIRLQEISRLVESVVAEWGDADRVHLRNQHRTAFTDPIVLTPLEAGTAIPIGEPTLVAGRNLSLQGVSFSHEQSLPYRDIVLTFTLPGGGVESMIVRLRWCRFTLDGKYQSGGRLLRTVSSPIGDDVDWNLLRRA